MGDEPVSLSGQTITLSQFTKFLKKTGRTSKCPACSHNGQWKFYIETSSKDPYDSFMLEFVHHAVTPVSRSSEQVYSYVMECPQCGFRIFTGAERVHDIIYGDKING